MTEHSPIIGDLVEEYRETVLPARGRLRATLWFAGQLATLVRPWMWGALLGAGLGVANLVTTARTPLTDDDAAGMLGWVLALLTAWTAIGYTAGRQHGLRHAVVAGLVVGTVTLALFNAANYVRVIVFVEQIQYRADWVNLMARFQASGATNLRWFAVGDYVIPTLEMTALGGLAGAVCGFTGGVLGSARRPRAKVA